jgi:hypothetical protein
MAERRTCPRCHGSGRVNRQRERTLRLDPHGVGDPIHEVHVRGESVGQFCRPFGTSGPTAWRLPAGRSFVGHGGRLYDAEGTAPPAAARAATLAGAEILTLWDQDVTDAGFQSFMTR